jgi:hypothetical protein
MVERPGEKLGAGHQAFFVSKAVAGTLKSE